MLVEDLKHWSMLLLSDLNASPSNFSTESCNFSLLLLSFCRLSSRDLKVGQLIGKQSCRLPSRTYRSSQVQCQLLVRGHGRGPSYHQGTISDVFRESTHSYHLNAANATDNCFWLELTHQGNRFSFLLAFATEHAHDLLLCHIHDHCVWCPLLLEHKGQSLMCLQFL